MIPKKKEKKSKVIKAEDLTMRFVAKSGERDMSIIAWDNVKLEYTEPETEVNNEEISNIGIAKQVDDVQAGNRSIQSETQEPNSTKIHVEAESTENPLDQSKNETAMLDQTDAPRVIVQTKQEVDDQTDAPRVI